LTKKGKKKVDVTLPPQAPAVYPVETKASKKRKRKEAAAVAAKTAEALKVPLPSHDHYLPCLPFFYSGLPSPTFLPSPLLPSFRPLTLLMGVKFD
jgi:hypothetical protein